MERKGQSQIITTILIILLVLAAIVIVWQVVRGTVDEGAGSITGTAACIGIDLTISGVTPNTNNPVDSVAVQVERGTDETTLAGVKVLVVDAVSGATMWSLDEPTKIPSALGTSTITIEDDPAAVDELTRDTSYQVRIAPQITAEDGSIKQCPVTDTDTFTA